VRRLLTWTLALLAVPTCLAASVPTAGAADPPAPSGTPTASSFSGIPTVGPIFRNGLSGRHGCTASVIQSTHHDLVLTAAHCVSGSAVGWKIVPGYDKGRTPYGVWTVVAAYVPVKWSQRRDPQHDYAILRTARQRRHGRSVGIQDVTGANALQTAPHAGRYITDVAYNAGSNDDPIRCSVRVYYTSGHPSFNCHGYVGGSSGSPWLRQHTVVGVIGGLHQGGCYEYTSYSSRFTSDVYRLRWRAEHQRSGDNVPAAGSDGC
jgi:V8-like Glu-specific endopeptidase